MQVFAPPRQVALGGRQQHQVGRGTGEHLAPERDQVGCQIVVERALASASGFQRGESGVRIAPGRAHGAGGEAWHGKGTVTRPGRGARIALDLGTRWLVGIHALHGCIHP